MKDSGKVWAALILYLNAIKEDDNDTLWLCLGNLLINNDLIISALLCFIQIDNPETGIQVAEVIRLLGWPDQALILLEKIERKPQSDILWHFTKAKAFAGNGQYKLAASEIEPYLSGDINEILIRYIRFAAAAENGKKIQFILPKVITTLLPSSARNKLTTISRETWRTDTRKEMLCDGLIAKLSKGDANLFLYTVFSPMDKH